MVMILLLAAIAFALLALVRFIELSIHYLVFPQKILHVLKLRNYLKIL